MQLTQTLAEGLKRQYKVVLSAQDLASRFETEIEQIRGRVQLNGFRPGKVPTAHIKKLYGRSIMAEVVQNSVTDAQKKITEEAGTKLAAEPKVVFPEDEATINKVLAGEADLDFSVDVEVLPHISIKDHSHIEVTREVVTVPEKDIDEAIQRMANAVRTFTPRGEKEKAKDGDKVTIDFVGTMNGVAFDGGTAQGVDLVLGSGQFIPGFEEQLVGTKVGDEKTIKVSFPESYQVVDLAGKPAEFAVTVKGIQAPGDIAIDDELAQKMGVESLEKMREVVKGGLEGELFQVTRQKMKRALLDGLDALYTFDLPPTMVEQEFAAVWNQVLADMQRDGKTFEGDEKGEAETRTEYRKIAERRVRLGLVLAEIGEKAEVKVQDDEVTKALIERARQFPGQEKQFFEFYRKNPQALAEIRAPLFEEKVVDHILGSVKISEKSVTREELLGEGEAEDEATEAKAAKPKKAAKAKKAE
ncbi:MAG: trigger factor [Beijerinckiaceae bacterium]|nr:trigger factor [Beijerinckiaceae bacterium]